jgi:hypothetical protein
VHADGGKSSEGSGLRQESTANAPVPPRGFVATLSEEHVDELGDSSGSREVYQKLRRKGIALTGEPDRRLCVLVRPLASVRASC